MIRHTFPAAALLVLSSIARAHDGNLQPGSDLLSSPPGGSTYSPPIPGGFFGPGSDPFTGLITLGGAPLSGSGIPPGVDTIVKRPDVAIIRTCPNTTTTAIQLLALSLVSVAPITVTFNGGATSSTYAVEAHLSSVTPQALGSMVLHRTSLVGGVMDSTLPVDIRLTFSKVSGTDGISSGVLDPAPHLVLTVTSAPYSYLPVAGAQTSSGGLVDHDGNPATPPVPFAGTTNLYLATTNVGADCVVLSPLPPQPQPIVKDCAIGTHGFLPPTPPPPSCTEFCFGDGNGTPCPCLNHSAVGSNEGCLNSLGLGGRLRCSGAPSIGSDTLRLLGDQMGGSSTVVYFQGTAQVAGGNGSTFGDGLRCAGGSVIRLAITFNVGGASFHPGSGDPPISIGGVNSVGSSRAYQAWYRNAPAFCTSSTFNLTNAVAVTWGP